MNNEVKKGVPYTPAASKGENNGIDYLIRRSKKRCFAVSGSPFFCSTCVLFKRGCLRFWAAKHVDGWKNAPSTSGHILVSVGGGGHADGGNGVVTSKKNDYRYHGKGKQDGGRRKAAFFQRAVCPSTIAQPGRVGVVKVDWELCQH